VLAGLALAATVLSNWIGAFALALGAGAYLFAGFESRPARQWLTAAALACYAYAIALPFVTPSIVATIRANAPLVGGRFESGPMHVALVAVFAAGFLALAWAMRRTRLAAPARFGVLFLYATAFIALAVTGFIFPCCRNRSAITSRWIWLSGCWWRWPPRPLTLDCHGARH